MENLNKKCYKCKKIKQISEFYKQNDKVRNVCKNCQYTPKPRKYDPQTSTYMHLFNMYKNAAKFRNLCFMLSLDEFKSIISKECFHCGRPPIRFNASIKRKCLSKNMEQNGWVLKNGVDRLDNKIGYNIENCVAACTQCNYSRQDYTVSEYVNHCREVVIYQDKKCQKK